ncbi:MAG: pitrilysin family protein [Salinisphaera sp.]|jgi:zinc protease|nr:pitrilysin family protein [Salinisphaera sp.]
MLNRFVPVGLLAAAAFTVSPWAFAEQTGHSDAASTGQQVAAAPEREAGVARETLANGLKIIVVPSHLAPSVTTMLTYDVGSRETSAGFPGTAHAQEHMMFRGTKDLSAAQISAISAAMGGDFNANTQDEVTQYFFNIPSQYLDVALRLHAERMQSVTDSEAAWKKERGAIEQEVSRDLSSPMQVAIKEVRAQLFAGTPYEHDALGTKASFDKTTAKMLKAFHDQWYAPNNATLVVAGDVDPTTVLAKAKDLFGGIPAKKLPARAPINLQPVKPDTIRMPTDTGYGLALVAFRTPGTHDVSAEAATEVLAEILNNPRGRLYSQLVATGKTLGAGFATWPHRAAGMGFGYLAFPKGADSKTLVADLRSILAEIAKNGVTPAQVTAARRSLLTQNAADRDSISGLAQRWSQAVAIDQMESPAAELKALQNVTAADINALLPAMLNPAHSILTVLTPKGSGAPASHKGFGGAESFTPDHVKDVKLPKWAAKPLASITTPKQTIQPTETRLANGLKLIVVPSKSVHAIHVYGDVRDEPDLQTPKGQEGVDDVLDQLLTFGTTKHDRTAYQAALDKIGASASAGTSFSLTVLPNQFPKGLDLLAENELSPALPKPAFKIVQQQVAGQYAGRLDSPDFKASQAFKSALYPKNDPTLRHATPQSIMGLTYQDVTNYYQNVFRPDLTTIVVVGDIDPNAAKQAVAHAFGGWKNHGKTPDVTLPAVPDNQAANIHVPDSAKSQDSVKIAETLDLRAASHDYRALQLGNQVLTGGFYASRLYRQLRADRGLVYFIHSGLSASRTRTHLAFQYGSDPDKVAEANRLIRQALVTMAKAPVSNSELHQARAGLIRQIPLNESSASDIGYGLLSRVELGQPLDEPYRAARAYQSIDAKAIQAAFKKWIRPDDLVHVVQGPAPK